MRRTILKLFLFLLLSFCTLELFYETTPPIFGFRMFYKHIKNTLNEDKENLNPNGEKIIISTNNLGFNSHNNFYEDSISSNDIAIIGDSFIASKQSGTFNSIAFFLDENLPNNSVYNFGVIGGNVNDYYNVYDKYNLYKLNKVFIMITGSNDLIYSEPHDKEVNGIINSKLKISRIVEQKLNQKKKFSSPNYSLIRNNYKNTVLLVHDGLSADILRKNGISLDIIELNLGKNFRYNDGHYNKNGNKIISEKIAAYLANNFSQKRE